MSNPLRVGILNGDDIGHEIVPASVEIARAAAELHGVDIDWQPLPIGAKALETHGNTLPSITMETLPTLNGWILGPIGHRAYPKGPNSINPHPILRKQFNLFANVRPTRSYPGIGCLFEDVDLVIVRENNEGFQPDRNMIAGSGEFRPTDEITLSVRVITRTGSRRVAKAAFELARQRRKHLTYIHKDTVFKLGCGMFVEECKKLAAEYPDVRVDDVIVDTFAMRLVRDPQTFDVVVTTNMFGDILSDEAAVLTGSLGMLPSASLGEGKLGLYEPIHGSAPDIAGKGIANPVGTILSAAMLLRHSLGLEKEAASIERAVEAALAAGARTADLGSDKPLSTSGMGEAIIAKLA
ncbi:MAG TPA: isocitrate/isopropylmalate family dehydrogenase [Burkholderiales bacterium]|jgi:3-isopropylmalate dehydrogenase|nr:isocitrate/isopropylmalate family dehydrogenase [Burkholderiales bacterium]